MTHGPDYRLTYIEATIQTMDLRGMTITPSDILTALWSLDARGLKGADAETCLLSFLHRLTPHWTRSSEHIRFPGWAALHDELAGKSNEELARRFGMDAVRIAVVVRDAQTPHSLAA
jgi:hypothetical protein